MLLYQKHVREYVSGLVLGMVLWGSCGSQPHSRLMTVARELAVERSFDQPGPVRRELDAAAALWQEAQTEIEGQRARSWALRTYRRVGRLLDDAHSHLDRARHERAQVRRGAERLAREGIERAERELAEVAELVRGFPVGRDTSHERAMMQRDVGALQVALARAKRVAESGEPSLAVAVTEGVLHETRIVRDLATRASEHALLHPAHGGDRRTGP